MSSPTEAPTLALPKDEAEEEDLVELVFRETNPLGIKIKKRKTGIIVTELPRGSQAEAVAKEQLDDIGTKDFEGAKIVGVNGKRYPDMEDIYEALKTPSRPKRVLFRLHTTRQEKPSSRRELLEKAVSASQSMRQLSASDSMRELMSSIEEMNKMNEAIMSSVEEMEKMNQEVRMHRDRTNSESSTPSRSRKILSSVKGRLARMNSSESDSSSPVSVASRAVFKGIRRLSADRSKSSELEQADQLMFGSPIQANPKQVSFIKRCEDGVPVSDQLEFETMNESARFSLLKEEAREACLKAIQDHLEVFVAENPSVTYEEWIEELHPENAKSRRNLVRGKSIDHRFYVEESDHRALWNENLGDGQRDFVPIRPYLPVQVGQKKNKSFSRSPPQRERKGLEGGEGLTEIEA